MYINKYTKACKNSKNLNASQTCPRVKKQKRTFWRRIISIVTSVRGLKYLAGARRDFPRRAIGEAWPCESVRDRALQTLSRSSAPGVHGSDAKTVTCLPLAPRSRLTDVVVIYTSSSPALVVAVIKTRPLPRDGGKWRETTDRGERNEGMKRWEGRVVKTHLPSCPFLSPSAPSLSHCIAQPLRNIPLPLYLSTRRETDIFAGWYPRKNSSEHHVVPCKRHVLPLKVFLLALYPPSMCMPWYIYLDVRKSTYTWGIIQDILVPLRYNAKGGKEF